MQLLSSLVSPPRKGRQPLAFSPSVPILKLFCRTANDFMRSAFGAGAPLFSHGLFVNLGVDWGCTLLGLISLLFIPLPFLLYKFGHIARQKSSKAES